MEPADGLIKACHGHTVGVLVSVAHAMKTKAVLDLFHQGTQDKDQLPVTVSETVVVKAETVW
jgi:hypothetical protein